MWTVFDRKHFRVSAHKKSERATRKCQSLARAQGLSFARNARGQEWRYERAKENGLEVIEIYFRGEMGDIKMATRRIRPGRATGRRVSMASERLGAVIPAHQPEGLGR